MCKKITKKWLILALLIGLGGPGVASFAQTNNIAIYPYGISNASSTSSGAAPGSISTGYYQSNRNGIMGMTSSGNNGVIAPMGGIHTGPYVTPYGAGNTVNGTMNGTLNNGAINNGTIGTTPGNTGVGAPAGTVGTGTGGTQR